MVVMGWLLPAKAVGGGSAAPATLVLPMLLQIPPNFYNRETPVLQHESSAFKYGLGSKFFLFTRRTILRAISCFP